MPEAYYDPASSVTDRVRRFVRESVEYGETEAHVVAVATVAINESAAMFRMQRAADLPFAPSACFPCRQILALEDGNPLRDPNGRKPIPESWRNDDELMELVTQKGWYRGGTHMTSEFGRNDVSNKPNNDLAWLFEYMLDTRRTDALEAFSIGANQAYLLWSPVTQGSVRKGNGSADYLFPDFDSLWRYYTAKTIAPMWQSGVWTRVGWAPYITRPMHQCFVASDDGGADGCIESWLQYHQTSKLDWTSGTWSDYAARVLRNRELAMTQWQLVQSEAASKSLDESRDELQEYMDKLNEASKNMHDAKTDESPIPRQG